MRNSLIKVFVVLALSVFIVFQAKAQDVAAITGTVTDPTGAVVPGVSITLDSTLTGASYKAVSNAVGSYTITNVRPGPGYKISFSRDGFNPATITDLYLNVNSTRTQNVSLNVGTTSATVEVSASEEAVTLNTTDATVGNNFQVQFLQNLPIANRDNPAALFTQQPGVTLDGAVTGARTDQNNVTLDGLDVNDLATGQAFQIVGHAPVDSVQEFRGVSAGEMPSAGSGGGGQFDLVTRSGTNQFHGALNEYHRDTDTQANSWFNNNRHIGRPPLIRNQFGGNIGGPALKNKLFFFFDYNGRRDTLSNLVTRTVPTTSFANGNINYYNADGSTSTLTSAQVAALDPLQIGFDPALLALIKKRYPAPNDDSVGDGINTAGFRFNAPYPYKENNYVGRVDYNLNNAMKMFARFTVTKVNGTQDAVQFPGDPQTFPFLDNSRAWVVGHTWAIGSTMTNQASFGETISDLAFPNSYNPTGITQYLFGGDGSGGTILDGAYGSAINAQNRSIPIPVIRDDFSWMKGRHNFQFGGTFKYISPLSNTILNYNSPLVGLGGDMPQLDDAQRPADIDPDAVSLYDSAFALALGRYASVNSTFNYNAKGAALPQGTGSKRDYRYYETEIYFGDTWKLAPSFTLSYGLRWLNYSVPYEQNGIESAANLDFNTFFGARLAQSAAGKSGDSAVPLINYSLSGKNNGASGMFNPVRKNFAPRIAFAYSPGHDRNTVFSGGAGMVYDRTVVNAVLYQQAQFSYIFQSTAVRPFGVEGGATASLASDPRFSGVENPPAPPAAPAITKPFTPFVDAGGNFGLANGQAFNETIDKNLKTPYSIMYNFGFQHQFPQGFLFKATYVGRQGRRLLAQADANQLIDFPDPVSGQMMSTAFGNLAKQMRTGVTYKNVTAQPWFENVLFPYSPRLTNTQAVGGLLGTYVKRGDFADVMQALSSSSIQMLPSNVAMGSQFSEFTYYTNKGFSSYNGLLATLHKNAGHGLQFDLNYTWSHSIDNVSVTANTPAYGGYGFICDVLRPRECRSASDFDVTQYFNGNFIYELPVGRGHTYAATVPLWLDEVIGGWSISGLPNAHTGVPYFATGNAFVAGYANNAPVVLTGNIGTLSSDVHKDSAGKVWGFTDHAAALGSFVGPTGFDIGSRNNLRGPQYFNIDLGLGKTFPITKERVQLNFRCDAFNALNHPSFSTPAVDITQSSSQFGAVTKTESTARVLQGSLRLEF